MLHIDLVGPLPLSEEHQYLLTMVDQFTCWLEALPLKETSTTAVAKAFVHHWVSCFGVPAVIISERAPQFVPQLWKSVASILGVDLRQATAYHPQSHGMVERFHRQLQASLTACLTGPSWSQQVPWVLLGIRAVHKADMGASPAEMVYGTKLHLPGQLQLPAEAQGAVGPFLEDLRKAMAELRPPTHSSPPAQCTADSFYPGGPSTLSNGFRQEGRTPRPTHSSIRWSI